MVFRIFTNLGGDALLVCSLTCLQRILDHFARYASAHLSSILITLSRLSARYDPHFELVSFTFLESILVCFLGKFICCCFLLIFCDFCFSKLVDLLQIGSANDKATATKFANVPHRICQIRRAMMKVELRVILEPFGKSCHELLSEPVGDFFNHRL